MAPRCLAQVGGPTPLELDGSSIGGVAWEDTANLNGIYDAGEPLLPGVTVVLLPIQGGEWDHAWPIGPDGKRGKGRQRATAVTDENAATTLAHYPMATIASST
ncbi:MAG: hypothetical protein R2706_09750 [Acidimicrobiales bacterium]